jgi:hypothetical protein
MPLKSLQGFGVPAESHGFANKRLAWETSPPLLDRASPLGTAHLRDPVGPQIQFTSESFIDEIAAAIGTDPVALRLRRATSPRPYRTGDTLVGRGIAYAQRSGAVMAIVAEVEIDRRTGKIWARKFIVAHDCGLIINPDGLRRCIEGNVVQVTSRALSEEVASDQHRQLPDPRHHRGSRGGRHRADQPPRAAARRRRRKLDPPDRRRAGQRRLRRHRRTPAPHTAYTRAAQAGAGVIS